MEELIWSYGEKPEKSLKKSIEGTIEKTVVETIKNPVEESIQHDAYKSSDDNYIKNPKTMTDFDINFSEFKMASNKRELSNNKLNERYLIRNGGNQNPFLSENNYLKDIENQQNFLIPKSSNE